MFPAALSLLLQAAGPSAPDARLVEAYRDTEEAAFGLQACSAGEYNRAHGEARQALDDARVVMTTLYGPARARRVAQESDARFGTGAIPCGGKDGQRRLRAARTRLTDALRRVATKGRR